MVVDDHLSQLGDFGPYQCYLVLVASIPQFLAGIAVLQNIFLLGVPKHRCYVPGFDDDTSAFNEPWTNLAIPASNSCQMYHLANHTAGDVLWSSGNLTILSCQKYIYSTESFIETAVSEWNLVCDLQWLPSLSTSVFMLGNIAGSLIYGTLSDKYGRRHVLALGALAQFLSAILVSLSPNMYLFTVASFLVSTNEIGQYITGYVLGIEFVGAKHRTWCASGFQIAFAMGQASLAVLANYIRQWRHLELCLAIIFASVSLVRFLVPESPKWLESRGRTDEAHDFLLKGAKWNKIQLKKSVPFQTLSPVFDPKAEKPETFVDIFKHNKLRRWSLNLFVSWAVSGFIYFGLSFSADSIGEGSSIYFTTAIMCITAIPFVLLITIAMNRWGRKGSLIVTFLAAGACCVLAAMFDGWPRLFFAIMGRGCIAASYAVIYIYSAEIYPTMVRSLAIGLCSTFSTLGGVIAPLTLAMKFAGESTPMILCGCSALVAGVLAFDLPETRGKQLPDTMDDVGNLDER
ncbi:Organic cation transporter protein [Halotydeus destructor]|nr:Organic cation transporter protein [Halotydeus destructor]